MVRLFSQWCMQWAGIYNKYQGDNKLISTSYVFTVHLFKCNGALWRYPFPTKIWTHYWSYPAVHVGWCWQCIIENEITIATILKISNIWVVKCHFYTLSGWVWNPRSGGNGILLVWLTCKWYWAKFDYLYIRKRTKLQSEAELVPPLSI